MTLLRREDGFSLVFVIMTFTLLMVTGLGLLGVVMRGLEGAGIFEQTAEALHVAEAGLHYGIAQLIERGAGEAPTDEDYAGEPEEILMPGGSEGERSAFRVSVFCRHPEGASPPSCEDDPVTSADERDVRRVVALGTVTRGGRVAQRQVEATVRRYRPPGTHDERPPGAQSDRPPDAQDDAPGLCGREGVELLQGTEVVADVGSNGPVRLVPATPTARMVRARAPAAPETPPTVEVIGSGGTPGLSGAYSWRVTFVDLSGSESGGGPPSAPAFLGGHFVRLTELPRGDGTIARRRVYRTRADEAGGPWYLVAEIPDNRTTVYVDTKPDTALVRRIPAAITGSVLAAGAVTCGADCRAQVQGRLRAGVREVMCPSYRLPPAQPGADPVVGDMIVQSARQETRHLQAIALPPGRTLTVRTLNEPGALLHLHTAGLSLGSGARLVVTGAGAVVWHVAGPVVLDEEAVLGAADAAGTLVQPASRIVLLVGAADPAGSAPETASVRLAADSRMAAVLFAPDANIDITGAVALRGALFGRYVRIAGTTGVLLDPAEGLGAAGAVVRPSPYQYVLRWYDNPNISGRD